MRRRRDGRGDRHDPRRSRPAAEAGRCYCRPMEWLAGLAAPEDEVPHDNDPRTPVMSTIYSSKFSNENFLREICSSLWMSLVFSAIRGSLSKAKLWLERTRVSLMRSGSVVGSLWTLLLIRPRLWRSLPLFPVKEVQRPGNGRPDIEGWRSPSPGRRRQTRRVPQQQRAQRSVLERRSGGVSLMTRDELRGDRPPARREDTTAMRRSQNLALSSWCFGPDDRPGGWNVHDAL